MRLRGFSLIELLVVLAVLTVLVGLTIPRLDSARFRADANVLLVRITLQEAQRLAVRQRHDVVVSFDLGGGRIRVAEDRDNNGSITAGEPVHWKGLTDGARFVRPIRGIGGASAEPVSGSEISTLDGMPTVTFYPGGSSNSGLEAYVQVDGRRSPALRGVTLAQSSGRTEWFKYTGAGWRSGGR
jgi:prepilin-type N-terminal cleavage/methylation domain-containing protein